MSERNIQRVRRGKEERGREERGTRRRELLVARRAKVSPVRIYTAKEIYKKKKKPKQDSKYRAGFEFQ